MTNEQELSEKAYIVLKENIMKYEKGRYLSARAFAKEIGISYTPVRDAFIRLSREGIIRRIPNVGFFVVKLDISDIIQIFQVRKCVEPFAFAAAFNNITDKHIVLLESFIKEQEKALFKNSIKEYIKKDEEFHAVFLQLYGNHFLSDLVKTVRDQYLFCSEKVAKLRSEDGIEEHKKIVAYIKNKDKEQACDFFNGHLLKAEQRMKQGFVSIMEG